MANIQLDYLYRDAGNYKRWANIVFSNPDKLMVEQIEMSLKSVLFDGDLFVARQIRIPEVFLFERGDQNLDDHCFHELAGITETFKSPSDRHQRSIREFLEEASVEAEKGWNFSEPSFP